MIDEQDIEMYLKARKQLQHSRKMTIVCAIALCILIALRLYGFNDTFVDAAILGVFLGGLLNAAGASWGNANHITQEKLLGILERVINKDPEAIKYLVDKDTDEAKGFF